jgi:hypothetical protein
MIFRLFPTVLLLLLSTISTSAYVFICKTVFRDTCFNFNSETSVQDQDKARVSGIDLSEGVAENVENFSNL